MSIKKDIRNAKKAEQKVLRSQYITTFDAVINRPGIHRKIKYIIRESKHILITNVHSPSQELNHDIAKRWNVKATQLRNSKIPEFVNLCNMDKVTNYLVPVVYKVPTPVPVVRVNPLTNETRLVKDVGISIPFSRTCKMIYDTPQEAFDALVFGLQNAKLYINRVPYHKFNRDYCWCMMKRDTNLIYTLSIPFRLTNGTELVINANNIKILHALVVPGLYLNVPPNDDLPRYALMKKFHHMVIQKMALLLRSNAEQRIIFCTNSDCEYSSGFIFIIDLNVRSKRARCPSIQCRLSMCIDCSQPYHNEYACESIDPTMTTYLANNTRPCPSCNYAIEKNGGCEHMKCQACNQHFCWSCSKMFSPNEQFHRDMSLCSYTWGVIHDE